MQRDDPALTGAPRGAPLSSRFIGLSHVTPLGPGFLLSRVAIDGTWTSCAVCLAAAFVVALGFWASVRWMEDRIARRRKAR